MQAQDIMTTDPVCVTPDTPVEEAARLMKDQNVGILPVVDDEESDKLIGVVTDRDIAVRHVAEGATTTRAVREIMSGSVTTCKPDADVKEVMDLMAQEQVRRIPIVDERGILVGVISQADIAVQGDDAKRTGRTVEQISQPYGKHAQ